MMDEEGWVQLENYPTLIAAELAKSRLSLSGIDTVILDGEMASLYTSALGGARLMVKSEDYAAAREILGSESLVEDSVVSEAEEITPSSVYCSRCHSKDVEITDINSVKRGFFLSRAFDKRFGFKKVMRCRNCGNTWKSHGRGQA